MSQPLALVVEDDADIAEAYAIALRFSGFTVETVRDGREAVKRLDSGTPLPDLVVLDLGLPSVPGTEVLRHIRADARLARLPVVVTTGRAAAAAALEGEADLVLVKPASPLQLAELASRLRPRE